MGDMARDLTLDVCCGSLVNALQNGAKRALLRSAGTRRPADGQIPR